tara:strand:+ start:4936 stop:5217 length:282 start_codon:yes stop_codon:yes gene_type:complete
MPYGYYQLIRFLALIGFSILAYLSFIENNVKMLIIFISLALLFQPFLKVSLGRNLWNIVDIIVSLFLIISCFNIYKKNIRKDNSNYEDHILKK